MTINAAAFGLLDWDMRTLAAFPILLQDSDLIAQKLGSFASCMSNQGFLFGEFQLEFFAQERSNASLDLFGFSFGANEGQGKIIGVPTIFQSSIVWIMGVHSGKLLGLFSQCLGSL